AEGKPPYCTGAVPEQPEGKPPYCTGAVPEQPLDVPVAVARPAVVVGVAVASAALRDAATVRHRRSGRRRRRRDVVHHRGRRRCGEAVGARAPGGPSSAWGLLFRGGPRAGTHAEIRIAQRPGSTAEPASQLRMFTARASTSATVSSAAPDCTVIRTFAIGV